MSKENRTEEPFIDNENPYFIGYNILTLSLENKNIYDNIPKSLDLVNVYLKSNEVLIYKKGNDGKYYLFQNSHFGSSSSKVVKEVIDNNIEKMNFHSEVYLSNSSMSNLTIIPIDSSKSYVLAITDIKNNNDKMKFLGILIKSLRIIISKMDLYSKIKRKTEYDALTGLRNRESYNSEIEKINKSRDIPITFTMLDLFRLKYVNDNINHYAGDKYIIKTAEILKKVFPEYNEYSVNGKIIRKSTGDKIYRIGGDEFIIISYNKSEKQIEILMEYVMLEIENIKLEEYDNLTKGINYGISSRKNCEDIEKVYQQADEKLSIDKKNTYKRYNYDRRK